jgi:hypothetical protein
LPVATVPLWQLVQFVDELKPLWFTFAPAHAVVT